jgi:hypothetical protein
MERLAQYIVRTPISLERMNYIKESSSSTGHALITYQGKTTEAEKTFTALDFLARLTSHIPNKGEQIVRYYGYYSNKSRGMRKKLDSKITTSDTDNKSVNTENATSSTERNIVLTSTLGRKKYKKNWARLIKKVFNIDPIICPSCNGNMKIISFIEDQRTVKKILMHLDLWMNHDPPEEDEPVFSIENLQLELEPLVSHKVNSISSMFEDDFSQEVFYED